MAVQWAVEPRRKYVHLFLLVPSRGPTAQRKTPPGGRREVEATSTEDEEGFVCKEV